MKKDVIEIGSIIETLSGELRVNGGNGHIVYCSQYEWNPRTEDNDMYECDRILTLNEIGHIMKEVDGQNHAVTFKADEEESVKTRDCTRKADEGRRAISPDEDMTAGEIRQLYDLFTAADSEKDGLWNVIETAFLFGYAVGAEKRSPKSRYKER